MLPKKHHVNNISINISRPLCHRLWRTMQEVSLDHTKLHRSYPSCQPPKMWKWFRLETLTCFGFNWSDYACAKHGLIYIPDARCMEYLPRFGNIWIYHKYKKHMYTVNYHFTKYNIYKYTINIFISYIDLFSFPKHLLPKQSILESSNFPPWDAQDSVSITHTPWKFLIFSTKTQEPRKKTLITFQYTGWIKGFL